MNPLRKHLGTAQREQRIPAIAAVVRRAGEEVWADAIHTGLDHQLRIGSITKTFTAVLIMQARDDGLLDLDDRLLEHLDADLPKGATIRRTLAHLGGVQREAAGDMWAGGPAPDDATLLADLPRSEAVLAPARRMHYSNLGFALLGRIVAEKRGKPYAAALSEHLLEPLGLTRTTLEPVEPYARGGFTEPWTDHVRTEPDFPSGAVAPAAQLWSTAGDVARWGGFLVDPDPAVLRPETLQEMAEVQAMRDVDRWYAAYGLGLMLYRRGDRILVGHGGAMPGFLAALVADRETRTSVAVLTAAGRAAAPDQLAMQLLETSLEDLGPDPWVPAEPAPPEVQHLLGHWWLEGAECTLSWHDRLELRQVGAPDWRPPTVFEPRGDGSWLTVQGAETGEVLRPHGDGSLRWATYALTRAPKPFADLF